MNRDIEGKQTKEMQKERIKKRRKEEQRNVEKTIIFKCSIGVLRNVDRKD